MGDKGEAETERKWSDGARQDLNLLPGALHLLLVLQRKLFDGHGDAKTLPSEHFTERSLANLLLLPDILHLQVRSELHIHEHPAACVYQRNTAARTCASMPASRREFTHNTELPTPH